LIEMKIANINRKIKAGSMPEALVAMTILVVVMLIAFSVLSSTNNYTKPAFKLDALMETNLIVSNQLGDDGEFTGESLDTLEIGRNKIIRDISFYGESEKLLEVRLTALAPNGLVLYRRNLIVRKDED